MAEPKRITSTDNPLIRQVRKLIDKPRARREAGLVVLDGPHLVATWLDRAAPIDGLLVSERGSCDGEITALWQRATCPRYLLSDAAFGSVSPVDTPSGILAVAPEPRPSAPPKLDTDTVLLDGVQDPGNLGSILRSAAAFGYRQLLLSTDSAGAWNAKTLRAGMGAHLALEIHENADLAEFLKAFCGLSLAADVGGDRELRGLELGNQPLAWVFGSEGRGLAAATLAAVQTRVRIPISASTESLNVGAAAAICLYQSTLRP